MLYKVDIKIPFPLSSFLPLLSSCELLLTLHVPPAMVQWNTMLAIYTLHNIIFQTSIESYMKVTGTEYENHADC